MGLHEMQETDRAENFIKNLYPKLIVKEITTDIAIDRVSSQGIILSDNIYYNKIPEDGKNGIVLAERVPSKFLGFLNRISAVVTLDEDPSTHLSIICRSQGVPVVNLKKEDFDNFGKIISILSKEESIAIDTFQKKILVGKFLIQEEHVIPARKEALSLIRKLTPLDVNANADTADELKHSLKLGFKHAWPRSETLLYDESTFSYFIAFLLSPTNEGVKQKFVESHTDEVLKLFNEAEGTRIAFRLLDPPSHEFLPHIDDLEEIDKISNILNNTREDTISLINAHTETNPMIGHRGARLLITNKEMLYAQAVSMLDGWRKANPLKRPPAVEVLIPFVMLPSEMILIKQYVESIRLNTPEFVNIPIKYGCMVEIPSILDYPEEIAKEVDFISFGTNDLVAVTHGIARGDAYQRYLSIYCKEHIFENDPFFVLPPLIVEKIQKFCLLAKEVNPSLTTDICGEQALGTNLTSLISSGALNAVSIGTENLPILLRSLIETKVMTLPNSAI